VTKVEISFKTVVLLQTVNILISLVQLVSTDVPFDLWVFMKNEKKWLVFK